MVHVFFFFLAGGNCQTKSALMEVESSSEVDESVEDMDEGVGAVSEGEEDDVIFAEPPLPELTSVSMI